MNNLRKTFAALGCNDCGGRLKSINHESDIGPSCLLFLGWEMTFWLLYGVSGFILHALIDDFFIWAGALLITTAVFLFIFRSSGKYQCAACEKVVKYNEAIGSGWFWDK